MIETKRDAIKAIQRLGLLNRFSTPADDWFVAASEHQENSDDPDDFIDPAIAEELIFEGVVVPDKASEEHSTRCWSFHLLEPGDLAPEKSIE